MKSLTFVALLLALGVECSASAPAENQTRPSEALPPTIVRVYDVRDLLAPMQNFPLSSSPNSRAFLSPTSPTETTTPQPIQVTNQLFQGNAQSGKAAAPSGIDELTKLIQGNIDADTWKDNGGHIGMLSGFHGMLVITQTKEAHQRIAQLLDDLAREQAGMVHVRADWVLVSPADAAKLMKQTSGRPPAGDSLPIVDPAVLDSLPASARHFKAQTLSRSGQTVYVISGLNRSLVTSATPVVSTGVAAYAVDLSNIGGGIALEINSRVNWERNTASVTLYSAFRDPAQVGHDSSITIASIATTQPTGSGQITQLPISSGLQPFTRVVQDMRTTVRVPLGVPVLVGGMTLQPDTQTGDQQQLLLVLNVTAAK